MVEALPYLLLMAAIVPLVGLMVTGSWRMAWRYTTAWARSVGIMLVLGAVLVLIFMPTT